MVERWFPGKPGWGVGSGRDGNLMFNGNSVSVLEEEKVLELDSSDG